MMPSKFKTWLTWQPRPTEFLALMRPVKPWPVQLKRYSRGIDNARIDVFLSRRFQVKAINVVRAMVRYDVAANYWNESESQPHPKSLEGFRNAYQGMVEGAMKQRRQVPPADWVRLVQLSLLKFLLQLVPEDVKGRTFYYGRGCSKCNGTGYRGRTGIFEIMVFNDEIRDLIMNQASTNVLRSAGQKAGMRLLRDNGLTAIYNGITTIDEIVKETMMEDV